MPRIVQTRLADGARRFAVEGAPENETITGPAWDQLNQGGLADAREVVVHLLLGDPDIRVEWLPWREDLRPR